VRSKDVVTLCAIGTLSTQNHAAATCPILPGDGRQLEQARLRPVSDSIALSSRIAVICGCLRPVFLGRI
jgi:hypothetical protein